MSAEEKKRDLLVAQDIGFNRSTRAIDNGLQYFSVDDLRRFVACLAPLERIPGSREPCGPPFNRHTRIPVWMTALVWSFVAVGTVALLPVQIGAGMALLSKGRWKAISEELPRPNLQMINWYWDLTTFIKAPLRLVRESVARGAALCVNRRGDFAVKYSGYAVMSHVWAETMGWQTPDAWGPVDLSLRRMGVSRAHFLRFFDRCGAEWLWVDVLAMPEALEDMSPSEKQEAEELRAGVINCLRPIYNRANSVVVLDSLLLRLGTRSPVDVGVALCLGAWMSRLWTYVEARLATRVVLKTRDHSFDLDAVIGFFGRAVNNEDHRYFPLLMRLHSLRDPSVTGVPFETEAAVESAHYACQYRYTDVEIDSARVLFPLLGLKWEDEWTLRQGFDRIVDKFPGQTTWVQEWCRYRGIDWTPSEREPTTSQGPPA
ncbi:Monocarboxylate transporter [Pleurostoma richardsiae]|uniref:Monocarboxylate transporter n=1 Tax=Pleurostoma richardsiae TaxID=41990 RepID=A0AA38RE83_9PEZI|nr:Monocarboxylate transporter [Pleurostoma richardsiae]